MNIVLKDAHLRIIMKGLHFVVLGFKHFCQLPDHDRVARHHAVDLHQPKEKEEGSNKLKYILNLMAIQNPPRHTILWTGLNCPLANFYYLQKWLRNIRIFSYIL